MKFLNKPLNMRKEMQLAIITLQKGKIIILYSPLHKMP